MPDLGSRDISNDGLVSMQRKKQGERKMKYPREEAKDVSIVICGEAGQGIKTVEELLVKMMKRSSYHVFSSKEYMSRIRGGSNSTTIRIGSGEIRAFCKRMDMVIPLSKEALDHLSWRLDENTTILFDRELAEKPEEENQGRLIEVEFKKGAKEVGGAIYLNIIASGLIASIMGVEPEVAKETLEDRFSDASKDMLEKNREALEKGYEMGFKMAEDGKIEINIKRDPEMDKRLLMKGVESIYMGAVSGGCDFISSYPMSPSTGVLVGLAARQEKYGIIAEQAEDEISAINMSLGAWYAGGRGMVTTSGGGFALMSEGLSLSAMLELPIVIHLAQRPGPATGLPTRTEQGDLLMTLFSGHGEFPRVIYTPGSPEEAFNLTARAFDMADRYQIPTFVLSDQFLVDSYFDLDGDQLKMETPERHIIESDEDYKRYTYDTNGISPRAIPGHGYGVVNVDSDEHDEQGHITESMETRMLMVEKRMAKMESLVKNSLKPTLTGSGEGTVIVCWGSTLGTVKEALSLADAEGEASILHISQAYPLNPMIEEILSRADRTICVENNSTGQMARLIRMETGINIDHSILKYSGLPFEVEELRDTLERYLDYKGG